MGQLPDVKVPTLRRHVFLRVPNDMRKVLVSMIVVALLASAGVAPVRATGPDSDRIYLLSTDGKRAVYSPDAADPELAGGGLNQRCNNTLSAELFCQFTFWPGATWGQALVIGPDRPLRFHLALKATAATTPAVHLFIQQGIQVESPPAQEISPGIWEGEITTPMITQLDQALLFGVRVRASRPTVAMEMQTAGRSWIQLPEAMPIASTRDSLQAAPPATAPSFLQTDQRRFDFNDQDWQVWQFTGEATAERTFSVPLVRPATSLYAWTETADAPLLHDVSRGRPPTATYLTDIPSVVLSQGGVSIGDGGSRNRAARNVPIGAIAARITPGPQARGVPYTLWVVAIHGERSLAAMRWQGAAAAALNGAMVATCPHTFEPVVTSRLVQTFHVDIDWSSDNPTSRWSPSYDYPTVGSVVCGNDGSDDDVRITFPADRIWLFDPALTRETPAASAFDTVLTWQVRFTYAPLV